MFLFWFQLRLPEKLFVLKAKIFHPLVIEGRVTWNSKEQSLKEEDIKLINKIKD